MNSNDRRLLVLLADDDADIRKLIKSRLDKRGYDVVTARNGEEALAMALEIGPDVAILDWVMPIIEGAEVCSRLKAEPKTANLPVILLTAKVADGDVASGFEAGADAYLVKPFAIDELDQMVRGLTNSRI